jgi:tetrathionate reductase subunit B
MAKKLPVLNTSLAPTRRDFLKGTAAAGTAAGVAALTTEARAQCPPDSPRIYPDQDGSEVRWAFVLDLRRCVGCQSCSVACKTENDVRLGYFRNGVIQHESGTYPATVRHFVPWLCNHCASPPCMDGCPVEPEKATFNFPGGDTVEYFRRGTYQRPDGLVLVDQSRCIGCGACVVLATSIR